MTREEIQAHLDAGTITKIQADVLDYRRSDRPNGPFSWRAIALAQHKALSTVKGNYDAALLAIWKSEHQEETAA